LADEELILNSQLRHSAVWCWCLAEGTG